MKDHTLSFDAHLAGLGHDAWLEHLDDVAEDHGYFEPLGPDHAAVFLDAGPNLLVTFEAADSIRSTYADAEPFAFRFAKTDGWSTLSIIADNASWFRHPAIYSFFDRQTDDGFFESFDKVLFHGAHGGGYAAAAYSVAAPGCTVLALRPQATLDPRVAGFDTRYVSERRTDFTSRYGYAPDMIDGVDHAFIAFDPMQRFDAIHAALFTRKNVTSLRCPTLGWNLDTAFHVMGVYDDLIRDAMNGTLDQTSFAKTMRARKSLVGYQRLLVQRAIQQGHPVLAANVCAFALSRGRNTFFESKLTALRAKGHVPTAPFSHNAAE